MVIGSCHRHSSWHWCGESPRVIKPSTHSTSRTGPTPDSVGEWLQASVTKTAMASQVGPILLDEGYAERVPGAGSKIRLR